MDKILRKDKKILAGISILILLIAYSGYQLFSLSKENSSLKEELSSTKSELNSTQEQLNDSEVESEKLAEALDSEQRKNEDFEDQIQNIAGTVGDLEKLSETDAELLQKYSKVYFLNEHYQPPKLKTIDEEYLSNPNEIMQIHAGVWPFLENLLEEAEEDGINLKILSAFRSFGEQSILKQSYSVRYGSGANTFSADQGYSEHQLGTTVDFTAESLGDTLAGFSSTEEYQWLLDNAHKYGFVLSYPENNSYYVFEPWHWRFVGEDLARDLHRNDESFYDWNQRDIDEYLINFFD